MQVTLHSTTKIVELNIEGVRIPARIWEGTTKSGIRCHAYITRIAAENIPHQLAEFDAELEEHAPPTPEVDAIPMRLIL